MTRYLVRGKSNPLDTFKPAEAAVANSIGSNSGNLLYSYGVYRSLKRDDVEIDYDAYDVEGGRTTPADIERINSEYDAYIIPLANAFRKDYIGKLNRITQFIRALEIPCIVIGVGSQLAYEPDFSETHEYDEAAKEFVSAALEKSSSVGVRGEITARYLAGLGFKEGVDVCPVGCPSMYTFGSHIESRKLALSSESIVSVNFGMNNRKEVRDWLLGTALDYPNGQVVHQRIQDLRRLYLGIDFYPEEQCKIGKLDIRAYREDRARMYLSAREWIAAMRNVDLSIGGRVHGSIAGVLGGAPTITIAYDSRIRELSEFHGIPCIADKRFDVSRSVEDLASTLDVNAPARMHAANFNTYTSFLSANGLRIPDEESLVEGLDECAADTRENSVPSIFAASQQESVKRLNEYHAAVAGGLNNRIKAARQKLAEQNASLVKEKEALAEKEKLLAKLTDEKISLQEAYEKEKKRADANARRYDKLINRRSVKIALSVANRIPKSLK